MKNYSFLNYSSSTEGLFQEIDEALPWRVPLSPSLGWRGGAALPGAQSTLSALITPFPAPGAACLLGLGKLFQLIHGTWTL